MFLKICNNRGAVTFLGGIGAAYSPIRLLDVKMLLQQPTTRQLPRPDTPKLHTS